MLSWDNVRRLPPRRPLLLSVMCIWFQSDSKSRRFDYYYHYYYWRKAAGKEWLWRIASFFFFFPRHSGQEETGTTLSGYGDSLGFWSANLSVACCGHWMMCCWSDRMRSMHTAAVRKGFVTSVTISPPVRMYTGCTVEHEYIETITFIYKFIHLTCGNNKTNVMMFTIIKDGGGGEGTHSINSSAISRSPTNLCRPAWTCSSTNSLSYMCESNTFTVTNTSTSGETGHSVASASNHWVVWQDKSTPSNAGITPQDCSLDFFHSPAVFKDRRQTAQ